MKIVHFLPEAQKHTPLYVFASTVFLKTALESVLSDPSGVALSPALLSF